MRLAIELASFLAIAFVFVVARELWLRWAVPRRVTALIALGQPQQAADVLQRLSAHRRLFMTDLSPLHLDLARAYLQTGNAELALALCDQLLSAAPEAADAAQRLRGDCLEKLGRHNEAFAARQLASLSSSHRLVAGPRTDELELDRSLPEGDSLASLHTLEGLIDHLTSKPSGNADALRTYLAVLRLRTARLYLQFGFFESAATTCELVLGRVSLSSGLRHEGYAVAARAYFSLESLEEAERDAQDAFKLANLAYDRPKLVRDCLLLGDLAVQRGEYSVAMKEYQRVRECGDDGRWRACCAEANLLALWGRLPQADQMDQRAFAIANEQADADGRLEASLGRAAHLADRQPAAAWEAIAPVLDQDCPDGRLAILRCNLAATLSVALERDPQPYLDQLAALNADYRHDRHLMASLDAGEGARARLAGQPDAAIVAYQRGLARPCRHLYAPLFQLRLAQLALAVGDQDEAHRQLSAAATFDFPLIWVQQARQLLKTCG